jgi:DnaJ family protein A protein 2
VLKVKGEGMPHKKSDVKGDLYLIVDIEFPEDGFLSDPQAAEQLQKLLPGPAPPIVTDDVDEVPYDDEADIEEFGHGADGGEWVDEDEEGHAQCATQ